MRIKAERAELERREKILLVLDGYSGAVRLNEHLEFLIE